MAQVTKVGRSGRLLPFEMDGIERSDDGVLRYLELPGSIGAMLRDVSARRPELEAIVEVGGRRCTYADLLAESSRVAAGLRAAGVVAGDRVAIRLPNGVDWVLAFLGIQLAGAVAVPVNTRFSETEAQFVIADSGSTFVVEPGSPLPDADPNAHEPTSDTVGLTDLAAIFYTSGTTGFPKGAMLAHENILATCENRVRVTGTSGEDGLRNLVSVPLFHVTGCVSQLMFTLWSGGTTVIMPTFDVRTFLRSLVDERITIATSVPAIWWLAMNQPDFMDFDLSAIRHLSYGGAPMAPEVIARLRRAVPNARLGNGFGLTETTAICTFLPDRYCDIRPETVGFAAPVVEVDLIDVDPTSGVGELIARGQSVISGYWGAPAGTSESFDGRWLRTGDLAAIDDDGFVQIVDRKKDMVNRGGENVYCVEVENALVRHPDVYEVAVMGVPDTMMGEKVGAVVVLVAGSLASPDGIRAWAKEQIADFKVPQFIALRSEPLPRNAGGKVLKPALREVTDWGSQLR